MRENEREREINRETDSDRETDKDRDRDTKVVSQSTLSAGERVCFERNT